MSSFRNTLGSALGTVTASADAVVRTVNTLTIGVDMVHNWASLEKAKQEAVMEYEKAFVKIEAKERATTRLADIKMSSANYAAKSAAHAAAYEQAANELEAMLQSK